MVDEIALAAVPCQCVACGEILQPVELSGHRCPDVPFDSAEVVTFAQRVTAAALGAVIDGMADAVIEEGSDDADDPIHQKVRRRRP